MMGGQHEQSFKTDWKKTSPLVALTDTTAHLNFGGIKGYVFFFPYQSAHYSVGKVSVYSFK